MSWDCDEYNGPGHQALRDAHADFNRLFGDPRLTGVSRQCFVSKCRGLVFAWCNYSLVTRTEKPDERNWAKDDDPGRGSSCWWKSDEYTTYYWGVEGILNWEGPNLSIRHC